jgi:hypothetical protein
VARPGPVRAAALLGGAIGSALVLAWWLDPSPRLDWTLPRPHVLTPAGVWHAAFLVGASALFAGLWGRLTVRLRSTRRAGTPVTPIVTSRWFAVALGGATGYGALAVRDGAVATPARNGLAILLALAAAATCLLTVLAAGLGRDLVLAAPALLAGSLMASGVVAAALLHPPVLVVPLLVVGAGAVGAAAMRPPRTSRRLS